MKLSIVIGKEGTNIKTVPVSREKKGTKNKNNNKRSTPVFTTKNKQTSKQIKEKKKSLATAISLAIVLPLLFSFEPATFHNCTKEVNFNGYFDI